MSKGQIAGLACYVSTNSGKSDKRRSPEFLYVIAVNRSGTGERRHHFCPDAASRFLSSASRRREFLVPPAPSRSLARLIPLRAFPLHFSPVLSPIGDWVPMDSFLARFLRHVRGVSASPSFGRDSELPRTPGSARSPTAVSPAIASEKYRVGFSLFSFSPIPVPLPCAPHSPRTSPSVLRTTRYLVAYVVTATSPLAYTFQRVHARDATRNLVVTHDRRCVQNIHACSRAAALETENMQLGTAVWIQLWTRYYKC